MKPFRKHVAIAIDGGGIRGVMVTQALQALEDALEKKLGDVFELAAGTSTGSVVAAGIALGLSASDMTDLFRRHATQVFARTWRYYLWFLSTFRYSNSQLKRLLNTYSQGKTMGDLWTSSRKFDLVIVARDLHEVRSRFFKSWKPEYRKLPITTAVLASSAAPTYFPVVEGRFVDGGVGSFGNPCFIAAYEARECLGWNMEETTLISIGTGKLAPGSNGLPLYTANRYTPLNWILPMFDSFLSDANDQQARIVDQFFPGLDFRRFQIVTPNFAVDQVSQIDSLVEFGKQLGQMILNDETDPDLLRPTYKAV
jgi:uncharacterized protein